MEENKNTNNNQQLASDNQENKISELKRQILVAEEGLEAAKRALFELTKDNPNEPDPINYQEQTRVSSNGNVIEGVFNGENMVGPGGKIFPVPANYASKSKLVEGDGLKLTISEDGGFIFKQIAPVKRKSLRGALKFEDNAYHVLADGHSYKILYASVTYHKGKPGDKVSVVVPSDRQAEWAVLESIIHDFEPDPEVNVDELNEKNQNVQTTEKTLATVVNSEIRNREVSQNQAAPGSVINEPQIPENLINEDQINATQSATEIPASNIQNENQISENDISENDIKSKLAIDEININPRIKSDTPKEVNANELSGINAQPRISKQPALDRSNVESLQAISEMDI
jgi:hypothetical protein